MEKIKHLRYEGGKFRVETVVKTANGRTHTFDGEPAVVVYQDYIQVGCVRISNSAVARLFSLAAFPKTGVVIQAGTYTTNDPNTKHLTAKGI